MVIEFFSVVSVHKVGQLHCLLSDAGIYSYAAVCALVLHELFDNEWDKKFNHQCMKLILEHLHLPKQVLFNFMYLNSILCFIICVMKGMDDLYPVAADHTEGDLIILCDTAPTSEVV